MSNKFWIIYFGVIALIAGVVIFAAGQPNYTFYHFEDAGIVCKKWNETWKLNYDHQQCWQLEKVQNANQN